MCILYMECAIALSVVSVGNHCSDTAELYFEDVVVPSSNVIGQMGKGFTYQMLQFQEERMWAISSGGWGLLLGDPK